MKARRWFWIACALLAAGWVIYFTAGATLAEKLGARFGPALLRLGRAKFNDPIWFLQNRFREALWLATLALAWVSAHALLRRPIRTLLGASRWKWTLQALAGFVFLNVWIAFAANTALFWSALGAGAGWEDYMRFQFKRIIAAELKVPMRAVLLGNSQTDKQLDEGLLNEKLGAKLWTTELHFPSCSAYDLLLIEPQLERIRPQYVICYLSEAYLYAGLTSNVSKNFFSFAQLAEARRDGAYTYLSSEQMGYGLLGQVLPVFRCRASVSQRFLGAAAVTLPQMVHDANLSSDLETLSKEAALGYQLNRPQTGIHKRALETLIVRCESANRQIVLLVGGVNPVFSQHLDPALRPDMLAFLQELKSRHPSLILVSPTELPPQTAADYDDLFHVNPGTQRRFTESVAEFLAKQIQAAK